MSETKRLKVKNGLKGFVPNTVNFSDLETTDPNADYPVQSEYGDDGQAMFQTEQSIEYEKLILQMLASLDMKEKLIFMYQVFRDMGFQIDHGSFAKTLHIGRIKYMKLLKVVKIKTLFVVEGRNMMQSTHK